ncbi:hypothetical protein Patl1_01822 [Pistacia atlantica]|uniref:Uncharacterized protein n=1 Tax=Pistacia atlantica TaxID=434234 RepID=A0ACC1C9C0_9ROSI|nr:hypothetical protein Patl1_01822 [Pistacia atlantica]
MGNYTFMDAVRSNLGGVKFKICGLIQFLNLFGVAMGCTIASFMSMIALMNLLVFGQSGLSTGQTVSTIALWWLSIVAAVMSFTYSTIGIGLGIAKVAETGTFRGSLTGISIGTVTETQKIWRSFQAPGGISFTYSYSIVLIEIQKLFLLLDIANAAMVIPSVLPAPLRIHREIFVILTTVTSMFLPFLILGALGFWPFTVYFPVEMYVAQKGIPKWTTKWLGFQILSFACLVITVAAAAGSISGVIPVLKSDKPFSTSC